MDILVTKVVNKLLLNKCFTKKNTGAKITRFKMFCHNAIPVQISVLNM